MSGSADARAPSARQCAQQIVEAFARYNAEFRAITRRAPLRFDSRDSRGGQRDAVERIELYDRFVNQTIAELRQALGDAATDRVLWRDIHVEFEHQIANLSDPEFTKTFFSSISRRLFGTIGVAPDIEFVAADLDPLANVHSAVGTNTYVNHGSLMLLFEDLLGDIRFSSQWRDLDKSIAHVAAEVSGALQTRGERREVEKVEVIRPVFYQISRAYIVGRIIGRRFVLPLVIALKNTRRRRAGGCGDGVRGRHQHRLQLHALLLPRRPGARRRGGRVPEVDHAAQARQRAVHGAGARQAGQDRALPRTHPPPRNTPRTSSCTPPGERGLVMVCFTLPSFDVVFKVIRDRFAYPKNVMREEVLAKYHLVFKHDRAGRLVDAQEFRRLRFPRARFSAELLEELRARDRPDGARRRSRPGVRSHVHRAAHDAA